MAVVIRARGSKEALVDALVTGLMRHLASGKRKLQVPTGYIQWPVLLVYIVGQYFYIQYFKLPELPPFVFYLYLVFVAALPTFVLLMTNQLFDWLVPPLELLKEGQITPLRTYGSRVVAGALGTVIFIAAILGIVSFFKRP